MRVFVFAIGGTGAKVLTSMIMQFASGAHPKDSAGNSIKDLSVVPILVDPHEGNAGLQDATKLLDDYRSIRNTIYGKDSASVEEGFFSVKIETLKDCQSNITKCDKFFFSMNSVSNSKFDKFIGLNSMSLENADFAKLLFSKDELNTDMKEGFYGNPNIGCIALNEFSKSDDFKAFCEAYNDGDKVFFIGSIFGGTGAAGLPLFISSIRYLHSTMNRETGFSTKCSMAPIGSLIVMPYFSIAPDENSKISENDWIIKSRSAISYYENNMNKYINNIYYIADPCGTESFVNDPGNVNNQKGNKAHLVEYIGAQAIFHFISDDNTECVEDDMQRAVASRTVYYHYGLNSDSKYVTFKELGKDTLELLEKPLMKFHLLRLFMRDYLFDMLDKPFAKDYEPHLDRSLKTRELDSLFNFYDRWIKEMCGHGTGAHNLDLFDSHVGKGEYTKIFKGIMPKKKFIGYHDIDAGVIKESLNKSAGHYKNVKVSSIANRWYLIMNEALEEIINDKYEIIK